jgi:hypothetical protein
MIAPLQENTVWEGWGSVIFVSVLAILIFSFLTIAAYQGMKTQQSKTLARETVARDEAYRRLSEQANATGQRIADEQQRIAESLADIRAKVNAIEKMLREVG